MQNFLAGTILGIASGIVGAFIFTKFIIWPKIKKLETISDNQGIILTGLFKDGTVMYAFQNIFAERLKEVEVKLDIESLTPDDYTSIQSEIINSINSYAEEVGKKYETT